MDIKKIDSVDIIVIKVMSGNETPYYYIGDGTMQACYSLMLRRYTIQDYSVHVGTGLIKAEEWLALWIAQNIREALLNFLRSVYI